MIKIRGKLNWVFLAIAILAVAFLALFVVVRSKGKREMTAGAGTGILTVTEATAAVGLPVDLTPTYNCSTSTPFLRAYPTDHLGTFPTGTNVFAGIRFAVGGMIQLGGVYPKQTLGIKVGAKANRVCLLHGTTRSVREGTKIAMLVLHYAQGEAAELPIQYGVQVRDWWMWNQKESPFMGPDTEMAWEGENELSKSKNYRIRVYATRFENPSPERLIETIDYVRASTSGSATPFLLGLTVE